MELLMGTHLMTARLPLLNLIRFCLMPGASGAVPEALALTVLLPSVGCLSASAAGGYALVLQFS
jgi:hypothetical protein